MTAIYVPKNSNVGLSFMFAYIVLIETSFLVYCVTVFCSALNNQEFPDMKYSHMIKGIYGVPMKL